MQRRPRREPTILGRLIVGAAALTIGGGLLLDNLSIVNVTPQGIFAVLLGIVGVGLLVGTFFGRARWLIIPGLILSFFLATSAIIPFHTRGGWGDLAWNPRTFHAMSPTYEHSAGEAVLNLTNLRFGKKDREVNVRLGFGELAVIVPRNVNVLVHGRVQGGQTDLFGERGDGWDIRRTATSEGKSGVGTLNINAAVTFGELTVTRGDARVIDCSTGPCGTAAARAYGDAANNNSSARFDSSANRFPLRVFNPARDF